MNILINRMTNPYRTLIFVILLITATSCQYRGKEIGRYIVTEEMKSQVPYKSHETITFTNSYENNFKFTGGNRIEQDLEVEECINCYDYVVYEEDLINFNNGSDQIRIKIRASEQSYLSLRYAIDGNVFLSGFYSPLSPNNISEQQYFLDSLIVNNTIYYSVYKDSIRSEIAINLDKYPIYSYYSTEYGILKIEFSDGTYWEYVKPD